MLKFAPLLIALVIVFAAGCAYAPPIRQGNFIDQDSVAKVKKGMTKAQVRFALGTPLLNDPFHAHRWDYVYYFQPNNGEAILRKHVVIYFANNKVSRIVKHGLNKPHKETAPVKIPPDTKLPSGPPPKKARQGGR
jgi:outer membrane protein assembly factor BamE